MISIDHNLFHIQTKSTSYVFRVEPAGHLEHLHYAARVHLSPMAEDALKQKHSSLPSATICYSEETPCLSMELLRGEISSLGKGDYGEPLLELSFPNGAQTCDFLYRHHEILSRKPMPSGLPGALPPKGSPEETLVITLEERSHPGLLLHLYYTAYEDCDVILRSAGWKTAPRSTLRSNDFSAPSWILKTMIMFSPTSTEAGPARCTGRIPPVPVRSASANPGSVSAVTAPIPSSCSPVPAAQKLPVKFMAAI